jgi:hypothetical protein
VHLSADDTCNALVQVAQSGGEAWLIEKSDAGNECIVKWGDQAFELLPGRIRHFLEPPPHKGTKERLNGVSCCRVHLRHSANQDTLVELTSTTPCAPVDVTRQNFLEVKASHMKDLGIEIPGVIHDDHNG